MEKHSTVKSSRLKVYTNHSIIEKFSHPKPASKPLRSNSLLDSKRPGRLPMKFSKHSKQKDTENNIRQATLTPPPSASSNFLVSNFSEFNQIKSENIQLKQALSKANESMERLKTSYEDLIKISEIDKERYKFSFLDLAKKIFNSNEIPTNFKQEISESFKGIIDSPFFNQEALKGQVNKLEVPFEGNRNEGEIDTARFRSSIENKLPDFWESGMVMEEFCSDEIKLKAGDRVFLKKKKDEEMWLVNFNGNTGMVPVSIILID